MSDLKCDDCGRFMNPTDAGTSIADIYDMAYMELAYEHYRCCQCTTRLGPVPSNAYPLNGDMSRYQTLVTCKPEGPQ